MTDAAALPGDAIPPIRPANLVWVGLALAAMVGAIDSDQPWLLNFVHVMAGVLWTGIDLFMGFVIGPILRRVPLDLFQRTVISPCSLSAVTFSGGTPIVLCVNNTGSLAELRPS